MEPTNVNKADVEGTESEAATDLEEDTNPKTRSANNDNTPETDTEKTFASGIQRSLRTFATEQTLPYRVSRYSVISVVLAMIGLAIGLPISRRRKRPRPTSASSQFGNRPVSSPVSWPRPSSYSPPSPMSYSSPMSYPTTESLPTYSSASPPTSAFSNNYCYNANQVFSGSTILYSVGGATGDSSLGLDSTCDDRVNAPGVWFSYFGYGTSVTAHTCSESTDFSTVIYVFTGSCFSLTCLDVVSLSCNSGITGSGAQWIAELGAIYYILVSGSGGAQGNFVLTIQ